MSYFNQPLVIWYYHLLMCNVPLAKKMKLGKIQATGAENINISTLHFINEFQARKFNNFLVSASLILLLRKTLSTVNIMQKINLDLMKH